MRLIHKATGEEVRIGDTVTDFRGDVETVTSFEKPRSPASSGFISTERGQYYASVFNCEWVDREDRPQLGANKE